MKAPPAALCVSLLTLTLTAGAAHADALFGADSDSATAATPSSATASAVRPGFGARIGGYGFRRQSDGKWDDCRMNGLGVFGTLDLGRYFFTELGVDTYQAVKTAGDDAGMDRVSALVSVAGGVRMFPDFVVTPFVQAGTGVEWTRVDVGGQRNSGAYPIGFFGVGGDLNVTRSLKIGSVLRFLGMAHPNLEDETSLRYHAPKPPTMEYQPAAQAQFYLRYVI